MVENDRLSTQFHDRNKNYGVHFVKTPEMYLKQSPRLTLDEFEMTVLTNELDVAKHFSFIACSLFFLFCTKDAIFPIQS